jgi:hypothetical protein
MKPITPDIRRPVRKQLDAATQARLGAARVRVQQAIAPQIEALQAASRITGKDLAITILPVCDAR